METPTTSSHFGMVHIAALPDKNLLAMFLIVFLTTGGIGYALGWLSLKKAREAAYFVSWVIHAAVNVFRPFLFFTFLLPGKCNKVGLRSGRVMMIETKKGLLQK